MTDADVAVQAMRARYKQGYDQAIFASTWGQAYRIGFMTAVLAMTEQRQHGAGTGQIIQKSKRMVNEREEKK